MIAYINHFSVLTRKIENVGHVQHILVQTMFMVFVYEFSSSGDKASYSILVVFL
jgi:hypothetical protein